MRKLIALHAAHDDEQIHLRCRAGLQQHIARVTRSSRPSQRNLRHRRLMLGKAGRHALQQLWPQARGPIGALRWRYASGQAAQLLRRLHQHGREHAAVLSQAGLRNPLAGAQAV